ncbi:hypothetical protein [Pseudomonas nitroreducens]|uniref:hypothetical protein n=1 Tax=Pseudomonas nitroreducens TaxID=46680 RepID=UPI002D805F72|nr:hypothetical protein [Pseudomonas nitroreducens]
MKVDFFWDGEGCGREPNCRSDVLSNGGVDFIVCLFTDHGGWKYQDSISWIDEGLSRVKAVKIGAIDGSDWSRDSWGVELKRGRQKYTPYMMKIILQ